MNQRSFIIACVFVAGLPVASAQQSTSQQSVPPPSPAEQKAEQEKKLDDEPDPNAVARPAEEEKRDLFNLSYYEPMYILYGNPASRVNFSFKYQFIRNFPIFLGYVQDIFWLFRQESHPFEDANYNPRLFYRYNFGRQDGEDYLDIIGWEHKSNGKSDPESRSYDSAGAKINWRTEMENWSVKAFFKGLYRYNLDETNKDLEQYLGPFEAGISISQFSFDLLDRAEFHYRVYTGGTWGENFKRASHEVGISFRVFGRTLTPAVYFQYFNGYSESLLKYDQRQENFRVGFLL